MGPKEVERPNRASSETHGQTVNRSETESEGSWREERPSSIGFAEFVIRDGQTVAIAVDTRPLVRLNLKQLEHRHRLTRRSHELQFPHR